jgi:hypothetical protein
MHHDKNVRAKLAVDLVNLAKQKKMDLAEKKKTKANWCGFSALNADCLRAILARLGPSFPRPDGKLGLDGVTVAPARNRNGTVAWVWEHPAEYIYEREIINCEVLFRNVWSYERVCKQTLAVSTAAEFVWYKLCKTVWASKVFVPLRAEQLLNEQQSRNAFLFAWNDRTRRRIEVNELTAALWRTRFKETAGAEALAADPWHQHEPCFCTRYNDDGTGDIESGRGQRPFAMLRNQALWRLAAQSNEDQTFVEGQSKWPGPDGVVPQHYAPARAVQRHPDTWVRSRSLVLLPLAPVLCSCSCFCSCSCSGCSRSRPRCEYCCWLLSTDVWLPAGLDLGRATFDIDIVLHVLYVLDDAHEGHRRWNSGV